MERMEKRKNSIGNTKKKQSSEEYESKLDGWSPSESHELIAEKSSESMDLHETKSTPLDDKVDGKKLSKAERKKLAQEAFSKAGGAPMKREKLSKAERRALQESQRAAKSEATKPNVGNKSPSTSHTSSGARMQYDDPKRLAKHSKAGVVMRPQAQKHVALFAHLPQYEHDTSSLSLAAHKFPNVELHPSIVTLGIKYAEKKIAYSNARATAMLIAFEHAIMDFVSPPHEMFSRALDKYLRTQIQYLIDCRPHCIGMGNTIRYVRHRIAVLPVDATDVEAKKILIADIHDYLTNRILLARPALVRHAHTTIVPGDVILTYAKSSLIAAILDHAHKELGNDANGQKQIPFRVIVVDSRPHFEGTHMVKQLCALGITCTYIQLNALSYIMKDVTKVFLGASGFMSNGVAIGRVGTALVAMTAQEFKKPVLLCCETYKFSDRVQLDAITHNELRDPDELVSSTSSIRKPRQRNRGPNASSHVLSDWRDLQQLKLLNLVYDVTPIEDVSVVVTELGLIPPTSVPAILREYSKDTVID